MALTWGAIAGCARVSAGCGGRTCAQRPTMEHALWAVVRAPGVWTAGPHATMSIQCARPGRRWKTASKPEARRTHARRLLRFDGRPVSVCAVCSRVRRNASVATRMSVACRVAVGVAPRRALCRPRGRDQDDCIFLFSHVSWNGRVSRTEKMKFGAETRESVGGPVGRASR